METSSRPSHRRGSRNNPSFSSSLLDAIDRSIDDSVTHSLSPEKPAFRGKQESESTAYSKHRRQSSLSNISTSSNSSSFGGFSSDADSIVSYRPKPIRTTIVRPRSELPPPPPPEKKKTTKVSISGRIRELRTARKNTLTTFLNGIFSGTGIKKKHKAASVGMIEESACPSGSCFSRSSGLTGGRSGGDPASTSFLNVLFTSSPTKPKMDELVRRSMSPAVNRSEPFKLVCCGKKGGEETRMSAKERRRIVEEMLKEIEDGGESDSSEDLFEIEIESLVGLGGGGCRDELPVFGTTDFETNRAIARGATL